MTTTRITHPLSHDMQATAEQIKAMLPIEGGVAPAVADKLRELLK